MRTHNHLLGHVEGCDGFKTGYITASGFSIAVTAARHGQRVIVVVFDSTTLKVRDAKAAELVAKGFAALSAATQGPRRRLPNRPRRRSPGERSNAHYFSFGSKRRTTTSARSMLSGWRRRKRTISAMSSGLIIGWPLRRSPR